MPRWSRMQGRVAVSDRELLRDAAVRPGDAPIRVAAGTADVFAVRADGLRYPLAVLSQGQCAFSGAHEQLLVVGRLNSSVESIDALRGEDLKAALDGFIAALQPTLPEVVGANPAQFPALLDSSIRRLRTDDAGRREQAVRADVLRSSQLLDDVTVRIAFSETTLGEPPTPMGVLPLIDVLGHIAHADGFSIRAPSVSDIRGSADPIRLIAHQSGVRYRKVSLTGDWHRDAVSNFLGGMVIDGRPTPVALLRRGSRYFVHRPGVMDAVPLSHQDVASISPVGYEFYAPLPADRPVVISDVLRCGLHASGRGWLLAGAMGLAVALLGLVTPLLTNAMVGSVIPQGRESLMVQIGVALVLAAVVAFVFTLVQSFAVAAVSQRATRNMQSALWDRLLSLPASFFRNFSSGDLTVRVLAVDSLQNLVSVQVVSSSLAAIFGLVNLVLMFIYSPALGVAASVFLALTILVLILGIRYIGRYSTDALAESRRANGFLVQLLRGVMKIRLAGAEDRMEAQYLEIARRQAVASSKQTMVIGRINAWFIFAISAAPALFYSVIALSWSGGSASMTTAQFVAFTSAYGAAFAAISGLSNLVSPIANAGPTFQLLHPIMRELPENSNRAQDPGRLTGRIEVDSVSFRYTADGPLILKSLSFSVEPGEMVALVGPSGAGKSTVTRLLLGFDQPEEGQVSYDGRDLQDLDPTLVRSQIGVVVQEGMITRGSIMRNILGSTVGDEQRAWQAAQRAALAEDIAAMPMQMQTIVDPANVSGGQAQRILLARALVRDPRILILDEATSALDNAAQAQITEAMNQLQATRIVIAHRLSTIRAADRIIVVKAGVAVETGTYDELIAQAGVFADLVKRQVA